VFPEHLDFLGFLVLLGFLVSLAYLELQLQSNLGFLEGLELLECLVYLGDLEVPGIPVDQNHQLHLVFLEGLAFLVIPACLAYLEIQ
jgi:hypothetical protein